MIAENSRCSSSSYSYMRTETKIKMRALTCLSLTSNQVEMCIQFIVSCGSFGTQSCGN